MKNSFLLIFITQYDHKVSTLYVGDDFLFVTSFSRFASQRVAFRRIFRLVFSASFPRFSYIRLAQAKSSSLYTCHTRKSLMHGCPNQWVKKCARCEKLLKRKKSLFHKDLFHKAFAEDFHVAPPMLSITGETNESSKCDYALTRK